LAITVPHCDENFFALAGWSRDGEISRTINPWEHFNYFSGKNLVKLLTEEGFGVVQDYGRKRQAYEYFLQIGDSQRAKHRVLATLRLARGVDGSIAVDGTYLPERNCLIAEPMQN
jgi:hypothetical protein